MGKTLGQIFYDNIRSKGFDFEETEQIQKTMWRNVEYQTGIWEFENYCEENKIRPTWFRYKKFRKLQEEKLKIYINSGGKDDRF